MFTSAVLCAVVGMLLGLRIQSLVVIPMNAVILTTVATLGVSQGDPWSIAAIKAVIATTVGDLGYLCGAAARLLVRRDTDIERDR